MINYFSVLFFSVLFFFGGLTPELLSQYRVPNLRKKGCRQN